MSKKIIIILFSTFLLISCKALKPQKVDSRKVPVSGMERARKNVEEGKSGSINTLLKRGGSTSYEFSSSNPMWRASLEILDFLPMTTVDYSGGMIITDWYAGDNSKGNESIKIAIRFLSNEVRADSLKIIVHKKKCPMNQTCAMSLLENSKISNELRAAILKKAAFFEAEIKNKK